MPDPVKLRFHYSRAEYERAVRRHFLERMHLKLDLAVAGGGALGCSLLFWRGGREWFLLAFLSLCLLLLALIGAAWFVLPGLWWRTQPKLHGEYQLDSAPEGIDFRTEGSNRGCNGASSGA